MESIAYNSSRAESAWRSGIILECERHTFTSLFEGKGRQYACNVEDREGNGRGESLTVTYGEYQDRAPKGVNDTILGSEGKMETHTDSVALRYFSLDTAIHNVQRDQEMISHDIKERELMGLAVEWSQLFEKWFLNQLGGNTSVNTATDYGLSGGNIVTAPDANSWLFCPDSSGTNADETAVSADDTAVLDNTVIDTAKKYAQSKLWRKWPIAPCWTPWGYHYVLICNGDGMEQLKQNSDQSGFTELYKAQIKGGQDYDLSVFATGEGFIYNNTVILQSDFCPVINTTSNQYAGRAVFFGAQAGTKLHGSAFEDGDHLGYSELMQHRRWSALVDTICGFKRAIVDGVSFGSLVISHYMAEPNNPPA